MSTGSTSRCLVRGSINVDEFFDLPHIVRPGETISSTGMTKRAGGKGANQAYALAKAGGRVSLDGNVGSDGQWVRDMLSENGVDVSRVGVLDNEVTGRALIQRAADGENSIVLHKGANYHLPSPPTEPDLKGYTHLLLQNEIPLDDTIAHLRAAGQAGLTTLFNPSPMLTQNQLRVFPWSDVSWLIVNEGEIQDLLHAFGISSSSNPATQAPGAQDRANEDKVVDDVKALANSELFRGKVRIVCTLGAQGLMWATDGQASDVSRKGAGKLKNPVKDTTGAGDCFLGYLTAGLMRGESVEQALDTCLAACAICVENEGAMDSMPSLAEATERRRA